MPRDQEFDCNASAYICCTFYQHIGHVVIFSNMASIFQTCCRSLRHVVILSDMWPISIRQTFGHFVILREMPSTHWTCQTFGQAVKLLSMSSSHLDILTNCETNQHVLSTWLDYPPCRHVARAVMRLAD